MDPYRRYWFPIVGFNYRMTNLEAAIGLAQLECIDQHLAARRRVAGWYNHHLADIDFLALPREQPWAHHSYWMYTVTLHNAPFSRDEVMAQLEAAGIETRPVFYPMHVMPVYREADGSYPVAEIYCTKRTQFAHPRVIVEDDVSYIAQICGTSQKAPPPLLQWHMIHSATPPE